MVSFEDQQTRQFFLYRRAYDGCSAVVLGGLVGSVERGEPVDSATKGEVVKSGGHLVSRAD